MATIIKLKRSTTTSAVPTTSNLQDGEVAVNITDKKIYQRSGNSIIEIANNTSGDGGAVDLSAVTSSILPDTTATHNIGSITKAFKDIFLSGAPKKQVNIFTNAGGLSSVAAGFTFRFNTNITNFNQVYTNSGGLSTPAITAQSTVFDDNNPAYTF